METLDEFQSITTGCGKSSCLRYQTYYDLLINACVGYDRTKNAKIAKRGHIYQTSFTPNHEDFINQLLSESPDRDPYMGIDTPSDEFYTINTNQSGPPMSARHKLQHGLLRINLNSKPNIQTFESRVQKMIYKSTMLKPFKNSIPQETYMKLI